MQRAPPRAAIGVLITLVVTAATGLDARVRSRKIANQRVDWAPGARRNGAASVYAPSSNPGDRGGSPPAGPTSSARRRDRLRRSMTRWLLGHCPAPALSAERAPYPGERPREYLPVSSVGDMYDEDLRPRSTLRVAHPRSDEPLALAASAKLCVPKTIARALAAPIFELPAPEELEPSRFSERHRLFTHVLIRAPGAPWHGWICSLRQPLEKAAEGKGSWIVQHATDPQKRIYIRPVERSQADASKSGDRRAGGCSIKHGTGNTSFFNAWHYMPDEQPHWRPQVPPGLRFRDAHNRLVELTQPTHFNLVLVHADGVQGAHLLAHALDRPPRQEDFKMSVGVVIQDPLMRRTRAVIQARQQQQQSQEI